MSGRTRVAAVKRRAFAIVLAAMTFLPAGPSPANDNVSGTINLPCVHPTLRKIGLVDCGWRFLLPTHTGYTGYRVHSSVPADLDIYFYDSLDKVIDQNAGPELADNQCVDLIGKVLDAAVRAIVVLTPSTCGGTTGQRNVTATYTTITPPP